MNFFETIQTVTGMVYHSMIVGNKVVTTYRYNSDDIDNVYGFWHDLEYSYTATSLTEKEIDLLLSESDLYYEYSQTGTLRQVCMYGSAEQIQKIDTMISLGYFK